MSDEVKHSLIWGTVIVIVAISVPWSIAYSYVSTQRAAIDAGLVQVTLPGASGVFWAKGKGGDGSAVE